MAKIRFFENGVLKRILALSNGKLKILDQNENVVKDLEAEAGTKIKTYMALSRGDGTYDIIDIETGEVTNYDPSDVSTCWHLNLNGYVKVIARAHPDYNNANSLSAVVIALDSIAQGSVIEVTAYTSNDAGATFNAIVSDSDGNIIDVISPPKNGTIIITHDGTRRYITKLYASGGGLA